MGLVHVGGSMFNAALPSAYVIICNTKGTSKNSKGVAGLAYQKWPNIHKDYLEICDNGAEGGDVYEREIANDGPKCFLAFTKEDWRKPSRVFWVKECLRKLSIRLEDWENPIYMPRLGCGHGQLSWNTDVLPLYEEYLGDVKAKIFVFKGQ